MKSRITGSRLCLLSNRNCPYYYLYSSPNACPVWVHHERPKKERCVFGDGPARYKHPQTQQGYCSMACYKRLEEEFERQRFCMDIPLSENVKSEVQQGDANSSVDRDNQLLTLPLQASSRSGDDSTRLGGMSTDLGVPASRATSGSTTTQPTSKSAALSANSSAQPSNSSAQHSSNLSAQHSSNSSSQPSSSTQSSQQMNRPMMVTSTTPDGKTVQYQLNHARSILVNSSGVNVPVSVNQVYYLQIDYNGHMVTTPHLMCGTTVKNGSLFYCMVPMVLMNNQSAK